MESWIQLDSKSYISKHPEYSYLLSNKKHKTLNTMFLRLCSISGISKTSRFVMHTTIAERLCPKKIKQLFLQKKYLGIQKAIHEYQMKIKQLQQKPNELLCPICLQIFHGPVTTSCNHIFCHMCLDEAILFNASKIKSQQFIDCPVCRNQIRADEFVISKCLQKIIHHVLTKLELDQVQVYIKKQKQYQEWLIKRRLSKQQIDIGDCIDVRDTQFVWCKASIVEIFPLQCDLKQERTSILVHYQGWSNLYDQIISLQSHRLSSFRFYTSRIQIPHYNLNVDNNEHIRSTIVIGQQIPQWMAVNNFNNNFNNLNNLIDEVDLSDYNDSSSIPQINQMIIEQLSDQQNPTHSEIEIHSRQSYQYSQHSDVAMNRYNVNERQGYYMNDFQIPIRSFSHDQRDNNNNQLYAVYIPPQDLIRANSLSNDNQRNNNDGSYDPDYRLQYIRRNSEINPFTRNNRSWRIRNNSLMGMEQMGGMGSNSWLDARNSNIRNQQVQPMRQRYVQFNPQRIQIRYQLSQESSIGIIDIPSPTSTQSNKSSLQLNKIRRCDKQQYQIHSLVEQQQEYINRTNKNRLFRRQQNEREYINLELQQNQRQFKLSQIYYYSLGEYEGDDSVRQCQNQIQNQIQMEVDLYCYKQNQKMYHSFDFIYQRQKAGKYKSTKNTYKNNKHKNKFRKRKNANFCHKKNDKQREKKQFNQKIKQKVYKKIEQLSQQILSNIQPYFLNDNQSDNYSFGNRKEQNKLKNAKNQKKSNSYQLYRDFQDNYDIQKLNSLKKQNYTSYRQIQHQQLQRKSNQKILFLQKDQNFMKEIQKMMKEICNEEQRKGSIWKRSQMISDDQLDQSMQKVAQYFSQIPEPKILSRYQYDENIELDDLYYEQKKQKFLNKCLDNTEFKLQKKQYTILSSEINDQNWRQINKLVQEQINQLNCTQNEDNPEIMNNEQDIFYEKYGKQNQGQIQMQDQRQMQNQQPIQDQEQTEDQVQMQEQNKNQANFLLNKKQEEQKQYEQQIQVCEGE